MSHIVDLSKLRSFADFAREKEVSVHTIYLWERSNKINTVEVGNMNLVILDDKAEAVENQRKRRS